jgi:tetratricopeptide repeat protein
MRGSRGQEDRSEVAHDPRRLIRSILTPMPLRPSHPLRPETSRPVTRARAPIGGESISLRLVIGREGVGLELARPVRLECLTVTQLSATLPGVRFPVDVSGGVPRFRHRRGSLHTLEVEISARSVERWAAPSLRGVVGTRSPDVWVGVRPGGAVVGVATPIDDEQIHDETAPVVAFNLDLLPDGGDLVLIVSQARGSDLPAPATTMAIACAEAMLRGTAKREGALLLVPGAATTLARTLFPEAGARVPDSEGVGWTSIGVHADTWILQAVRGLLAAHPREEALRAREVAVMLREADEALVAGDLDAARSACFDALERAPRHGEIVRRILEVDARAPERAEAALALLAEAGQADACLGTAPGDLRARIGDVNGALASLELAGDREPMPSLAARAYEHAARLTLDPERAAWWLDRALARAARSTTARWLRVTKRLALGRIDDALSDVEHLEALARGQQSKHRVWWRAGCAWQSAGLGSRAAVLFERALRYAPEDARVLAGLGQALVEEGRNERGIAVLTRGIELADQSALPTSAMLLDLARALAEKLDDLPAAIARVSSIPPEAPEAPLARGLEGRWRARLGDIAGAALAFARLREMALSLTPDGKAGILASLLVEGAQLQHSLMNDVRGAQRTMAAALHLLPHDPTLRQKYRDLGALLVRLESDRCLDPLRLPEAPRPADEAARAARVEDLTRQLQANPHDEAAADELAELLESLDRGHELLALLLARLEEAPPGQRDALVPRARAALERLAADAQAAGRLEEAALYRSAIPSIAR